ncbi:hypothetical protein DPEC_G00054180 [Dallia pectoralis]|uniref:Uncharacterized protein n=1 Tax=Dallia pectoralis TaxID=75939 RepID=A0ACC2H5N9_DALPE|nr:hypothetical protein DPEC_G00054180 [Dallia pectoralis]
MISSVISRVCAAGTRPRCVVNVRRNLSLYSLWEEPSKQTVLVSWLTSQVSLNTATCPGLKCYSYPEGAV